jgi:hypothetical protein
MARPAVSELASRTVPSGRNEKFPGCNSARRCARQRAVSTDVLDEALDEVGTRDGSRPTDSCLLSPDY